MDFSSDDLSDNEEFIYKPSNSSSSENGLNDDFIDDFDLNEEQESYKSDQCDINETQPTPHEPNLIMCKNRTKLHLKLRAELNQLCLRWLQNNYEQTSNRIDTIEKKNLLKDINYFFDKSKSTYN